MFHRYRCSSSKPFYRQYKFKIVSRPHSSNFRRTDRSTIDKLTELKWGRRRIRYLIPLSVSLWLGRADAYSVTDPSRLGSSVVALSPISYPNRKNNWEIHRDNPVIIPT